MNTMNLSRRGLALGGRAAIAFLALLTLGLTPAFVGSATGAPLDPTTIPKYVTPLHIPPAMPLTTQTEAIDYYEIAVRQFQQQILPAGFPQTTVWSYGSVNSVGSFHYPANTIEATVDKPVRVKWINDLKDANGNYLPHLLPVDQTIHWANPPAVACNDGTDRTDCTTDNPASYTGPVPIVTHLHGSHVTPESDGFPEAWYLPAANNIPSGYAARGSNFDQIAGAPDEAGAALFEYRNDQRATTLWYHDHSLGMTRLNVYAGPVGFYLLRGGSSDLTGSALPGPAPRLGDPFGTKYYEIPIVLQDRSFNTDGSLFYPPIGSEVHEKFEGDTIVANGNTWPYLNVEPRRYRFRFLNASNAYFFKLKMKQGSPNGKSFRPFWQIGADGGFLPAPVSLKKLEIAPAERADVIVDFTGVPVGTAIYLTNDTALGRDQATTGQVMKFVVTAAVSTDQSSPIANLGLPQREPLGPATRTRHVAVFEHMLGTFDTATGVAEEKMWADAITEDPALDATEVWEIHGLSEKHPIHLHQVQFEILGRIDEDGVARGPEPGETGTKDTLIVRKGEITRIKAKFDIPGLYVWHCHILEHEDDEMMRSYCSGDPANCQP